MIPAYFGAFIYPPHFELLRSSLNFTDNLGAYSNDIWVNMPAYKIMMSPVISKIVADCVKFQSILEVKA